MEYELIQMSGLKTEEEGTIHYQMIASKKKTGLPFFNMDKIKNTLRELIDQGVSGIDELYGRVDIRDHLSVDPNPNSNSEVFECMFFEGNMGWFYTHNGVSQYYSRPAHNPKKFPTIAFNLIGLLKIFLSMRDMKGVYEYLKENLPYKEGVKVTNERDRYRENRLFLKLNFKSLEDNGLLSLEDYQILNVLMELSEAKLYDTMKLVEGKSYFFASLEFILSRLKRGHVKISRTALSNRINRLATLGFIRKLGETSETSRHYKESSRITKRNQKEKRTNQHNVISYYSIETFSKVIKRAEKNHRKLNKKNIRLDQITEAEVEHCFGTTWAKRVYPVKTKKKKHKYVDKIKAYKKEFFYLLKKQGFVSKQQLAHLAHTSLANRLWTQLVNRTTGIKKRSSKAINSFLDIQVTGDVFMLHSLFHSMDALFERIARKGELWTIEITSKEIKDTLIVYREPIFRWLLKNREPDGSAAIC